MGLWPHFIQTQRLIREEDIAEKEIGIFTMVWRQGNIVAGEVKRLTHYLLLTKGEYTQILYNGTSSGMNESLREPKFALTTIQSTIWAVDRGNYMAYPDNI